MRKHTAQSNPIATNLEDKLRKLGAVQYDLWVPETGALPGIIHDDEEIVGIVYGRYTKSATHETGRGVLVATTQRILLIDKKPLLMKCDELMHSVVSAVSFSKVGIAGTVSLHTRMGDINVRTFNKKCATGFVKAIEAKIIKDAQTNA
jgi:hypothetical protein